MKKVFVQSVADEILTIHKIPLKKRARFKNLIPKKVLLVSFDPNDDDKKYQLMRAIDRIRARRGLPKQAYPFLFSVAATIIHV